MTSVEQALVQAVRGPFLDWLAGYDFVPGRFDAFMAGACPRLVAMGIPIWRAALGLERLHPEEIGSMMIWREGTLIR